jgi:peptidoglycan/LPS O-acetylase OafA/YrhL
MPVDCAERVRSAGSFRPELDGLRTIAIGAVIVHHFNKPWIPSGYLGVDLFFVISGYVITASLARRPATDFKDFWLGFLGRRVQRLLPALLIFVVVVCAAAWLLYPEPGAMVGLGWRSLFGISNIWLNKEATDYFSRDSEFNLFTHTWSLGVEAQFYLLFPLLVWLSGFARQQALGARKLSFMLGVLAIPSLAGFIHLYSSHQSTVYLMMPFHFWELAAGCLVFLAMNSKGSQNLTTTRISTLDSPVLLMAITAIFFLPRSLAIPATLACVGLSSLLIVSLGKQGQSSDRAYRLLILPAILCIGMRSYSLYLWHWPVLAISRWTIGIHWWTVPIQLGMIASLSVASYHWVEMPARRLDWSGKRWLTNGLIAAISTTAMIGMINRYYSQYIYSGDLQKERRENMIGKIESSTISDQDCTWFQGQGPSLNTIETTFQRCTMRPASKAFPKKNPQHLYIIGDSHAGNYIALLPMLSSSHDLAITSLHVKALPPPLFTLPKDFDRPVDAMAQLLITRQVIERARAGDIILISRYLLEGTYSPAWVESVKRFTEAAHTKGASVIISLPIPGFQRKQANTKQSLDFCTIQWYRPHPSPECHLRANRMDLMKQIQPIHRALRELSRTTNNVKVFDPFPVLCPSGQGECSNYLGSKRTYHDGNHLNYLGSQLVGSSFIGFLVSQQLIH